MVFVTKSWLILQFWIVCSFVRSISYHAKFLCCITLNILDRASDATMNATHLILSSPPGLVDSYRFRRFVPHRAPPKIDQHTQSRNQVKMHQSIIVPRVLCTKQIWWRLVLDGPAHWRPLASKIFIYAQRTGRQRHGEPHKRAFGEQKSKAKAEK